MRLNKLYISLITAITFAASGCSDFLSVDPTNERALRGYEDVKIMFSRYMYDQYERGLPNHNLSNANYRLFTSDMLMMFEAYADNLDPEKSWEIYTDRWNNLVPNNREVYYADKFLYNDFSTPQHIWNEYYRQVGFLNTYIDAMADFDDCTLEQRHQLVGELKMHRAYYLFKLYQYFAQYNSEENGIPIYLHTGDEVVGIQMPRKTHTEVYEILLDDLYEVKEMLDETEPKSSFNVMYDRRSLYNLLAQVYWFKAESPAQEGNDYQNAKEAALIASEGIEVITPRSYTEYTEKMGGRLHAYPHPFIISSNSNTAIAPVFGARSGRPTGMSFVEEFYNSVESNDIRWRFLLRNSGPIGNPPVVNHTTWPSTHFMYQKYGSFYLFEIENAYLMLAECHYRLGNEAAALEVVNNFREWRGLEQITVTGEELLAEIISERRKEFAGIKDYRWLDMKRYGVSFERSIKVFDTYEEPYTVIIEPNSYQFALPIPLRELQENPHISQNPGWVNVVW
ncbi:RagB/SusD family nutrient uptake outer membrane protein [Carboxylicivirga mesophila]|uniref:RagB/SusD family nutrient uptake outer membrane protein n=1 Tax=Carboxylicivirga mesophila TaxID=1166478 RepID=A0ABS5KBI4_9BACT|nr:RagB/SusD family nutrient uptake outer membrane protein [Carboxylicivirga mesophila]MBS2211891.1 RagB/SusD family nutrient uptake outer membrane protein [Carboxylicivirga mesophila]